MRIPARHLRRSAAILAAAAVFLTSGCSLDGRGSLPWTRGTGDGSYEVTIHMADVSNLVPNAEVKANAVTVGAVTAIRMQDWQAVLTVSLARSARLPANAIANVGQKSLLGAQYLQLDAPTGVKPSARVLSAGSVIPIERTGTYPDTEDLLIALSSFLNGSGLMQLKTIVGEMNKALDGRTDDIRNALLHMQQVSGELNAQRRTIAQLLDRMDRLSGDLAKQAPLIERSLPTLGPGLAALNKQRPVIIKAMNSVTNLDAVATPVLKNNTTALTTEVRQLRPTLSRVADAGNAAADALETAGTVVYPQSLIKKNVKGDYQNLFVNQDATVKRFGETLFAPASENENYTVGTVDGNAPTNAQLIAPTTRGGSK